MITNTSDEQKNVDQVVGIDNSDYNDEDYVDESDYDTDAEYDSDVDSDYEEDEESDEDSDAHDEEEERHQFYRQQAFEFDQDEEIPALMSDSDSVSDTEVLTEDDEPINIGPPPVLRRELTEDYLTPVRNTEVRTPSAPERRRVLTDLTNITPRRLAFN